MTHHVDVASGRDIIARWCNLAEQRLEYLTELFETGRWRRYHTERAFLENIQEAKAAVEIWRNLEMREASLDNSAVDLSWLGRGRSTPRCGDGLRERVQLLQPQPARAPAEPPPCENPVALDSVRLALNSQLVASDEAPSVPEAPAAAGQPPLPTLDLEVMRARYPLLRNAF